MFKFAIDKTGVLKDHIPSKIAGHELKGFLFYFIIFLLLFFILFYIIIFLIYYFYFIFKNNLDLDLILE